MSRLAPTLATLTLLSVLLSAAEARATQCEPRTWDREVEAAEVVFRGRVLDVHEEERGRVHVARVEVLGVYKGQLGPRIWVRTEAVPLWPMVFAQGQERIFLAERREGPQGSVWMEGCAHTLAISEREVLGLVAPFQSELRERLALLGPERTPGPTDAATPSGADPLGDTPLQLLVVLGLAFVTIWLGVSVNLSTRRRATGGTRLRTLARRRRRP